jgi:hypothetical protein
MRKRVIGLFLLCFLSTAYAAGAPPSPGTPTPTGASLWSNDFPYTKQQADELCWAASAEMIMAYWGRPYWKQCIQADDTYPNKTSPRTCCDDPKNIQCNRTGWPNFSRYRFHVVSSYDVLGLEEVANQIAQKHPIAVAVRFAGGGGHMTVVVGYTVTSGNQYNLWVADPDGIHKGVFLPDELLNEAFDGIYTHWRYYSEIFPLP